MGGKSKAPKPPDMSGIIQGQLDSAKMWADVAREGLAWAKESDGYTRDLLERVLGVQLPQMEAAFENAQKDRARYENVFQPIEDNLIKEFESFDSPERREEEAAQRQVDANTQFEAQRRNATRELEDFGVDVSQTRHQALDLGLRTQQAAASALAANQGRKYVEETGRALRGEAINIGRGMPAQVAQSQGIVNQTAGGAMGNANSTFGNSSAMYQGAYGAGGLSQSGYSGAGNTMNSNYQNQMAQYNANTAAAGAPWNAIGGLAGAALGGGMFSEGGMWGKTHEGGPINDQTAVPTGTATQEGKEYGAILEQNEFVIPADVVRRKGTEFFDKLLERYKDGGEYEGKQQGVPA